jgi:hypothetical protein
MMHYSVRISENGKVRYFDAQGYTPGDALNEGIMSAHIRKGATVSIGAAQWVWDEYVAVTTTYQHVPERDTERYSAWQLVGADHIEWMCNKPY